jgi:hypothetical protein
VLRDDPRLQSGFNAPAPCRFSTAGHRDAASCRPPHPKVRHHGLFAFQNSRLTKQEGQ